MRLISDKKLDFSDVLIVPQRSELSSRKDVDLEREFIFKHSGYVWKGVPIIVSNMDTTGTVAMAKALEKYKVITCLHKFHKYTDIPTDLNKNYYMVSTGVRKEDLDNLDEIMENIDPIFICVDVANGYSTVLLETVKYIRKKYPTKVLVAGNVVTTDMAQELVISGGVDIIKAGLGNGSVCTTRLKTGVGYPQLSCVIECSNILHGLDAHIISDGGIQVVGDLSKAFGAGADFVMCGSMFSGHDEAGGEIVEEDGKKYKLFYGMSSAVAMDKYHGGVANYRSAEGKCVKVSYKGPVSYTIEDMLGGVRSCMTYIGARKMKHLSKCCTFIKVNNQANNIYK